VGEALRLAAGVILLGPSAYLLVYAAYYTFFALVGLWPIRRSPAPAGTPNFALLVPAHNEAKTIARVVRSLESLDYPADRRTIVVLADNCDDDTAEVAAGLGVRVMVRGDPLRPGKGQALEWAFARLLSEPSGFDAFCVFDADNRVDAGFLRGVAGELERGAEAVQGYLDTLNPDRTLLAGVSAVAYYSANRLFQLPRARLGLSAILGGTGVCLATGLLRRIGWGVTALTEDLEYQAKLTLAGVRVTYAPGARVFDEKPEGAASSLRQRLRWMQGYWDVAARYLPRLLAKAARGSPRCLELALYLVAPPRSLLTAAVFAMGVATLLMPGEAWLIEIPAGAWFAIGSVLAVLPLLALPLERAPARVYASVPLIPLFAVSWAPLVVLGLVRRGRREWVGTAHTPDAGM
jgi:cellulose synthase/poly-beta-1,6-N-acetylglucosamine synthase-like glycosyltransferase